MKNSWKKLAAVLMIAMVGVHAYAQEPNAPNKINQASPKDEFVQALNDFQPQLDNLNVRSKENASRIPDFAKEVSTLNDMVSAFQSKLDKLDQTATDQQSPLVATLRTDWSAIQTQYKKASDLWDMNNPEKGEQSGNK